ncbi:hypothetical protein [Streptomyces californicus]
MATKTTHPAEDHGASAAEILRRAQADRQAQVEKDRARREAQ